MPASTPVHGHTHSSASDGPRLANVEPIAPAASGEGGSAKKKRIIKIVGAVVVLALVAHVVTGKVIKPHYGANVPNAGTYGLGSITTNLSDGHLAQISVTLQLTKAADSKKIATDTPALTSATVNLIGQQSFSSLLPPSGRAALRSALLSAFQGVLGIHEGAKQVSAVYLTSFVLQ
jgi:flagellar basal body-associated protein FliL